jgi:hypothetical protein
MSETFDGRCACGEVRYRLGSRPMFVNCCHCLDCQRQTGSAFVINAIIEADRIEMLSGAPVAVRVPTDSGDRHDIYRCPKCQTAVWSDYGGRPFRFVRVGTLETPSAIAPDAHIFTRSRQPWVGLPGNVPAFAVYYDTKTLWSAEAQARRKAALAG